MAIAYVAQRGILGVVLPSGTQAIPLTNPTLILPGNTLFLLVSAQNSTSDVSPIGVGSSVIDPRGNNWVAEAFQSSSDGGTNHGATVLIYRCLVQVAYQAGDSISVTSTIAGRIGLFEIHEFSGVSQGPFAMSITTNRGISTTTSTALSIPVLAAGQLVLVAGGVGTTNAIVTDTDTLDGIWSAAQLAQSTPPTMSLWESHKILTGFTSSTQSYNATWTSSGGDNTFGQIALVYDPSNFAGNTFVQQFPPQDNPNYSCPDAGFEPLPTSTAKVSIDTGTAYQIEHQVPAASVGTHFYAATAQYDDSETAVQQHHVAYDLYRTGAEVPEDTVTTLVFPVGLVNLPVNEVQSVTEGGAGLTSFTLTFSGQTTVPIAASTTAVNIQNALGGLSNIGFGNVLVNPPVLVTPIDSTTPSNGPWTVVFTGALANTNVAQMTATPTGGTGTVTIATVTAGGGASGGATVIGGGTALAALSSAGGAYIKMDTTIVNHAVQCQFNLTTGFNKITNYANSRIVRVGLRFAAWKDDSSTLAFPVGEALQAVYQPSILGVQYEVEMGAWLTPDYKRAVTQQNRWLGETNPMPKIPDSSAFYGGQQFAALWFRTPPDAGTSWSYNDVLALGTGNTDFLKFYALAGADFTQVFTYFDFVELVVEVAPERRLGNAVHNIASTPQYASSPLAASSYLPGRAITVALRSVIDQSLPLTISGTPNDYTLVARESLPASSSDYYPALATAPGAPAIGGATPPAGVTAGLQLYSPMEAVGPSLAFNGYTQARPMVPNQRPLSQRVVVDGVFASGASLLEQYTLSFGALDLGNFLSAGAFFPVPHGMSPVGAQQVYTGHSQTQRFYDGAGSVYDQVKVVCRPDPLTTANLSITTSPDGSTTTITPTMARAGTDLGFGWFEVTAPMAVGFTGSGAVQTMTFTSSTSSGAPWFVSAVRAIGPSITLTFEPIAQNISSTVDAYAAVLECAMATPILTLGTSTITINPADKAICRSSTYDVPVIGISNSSSFDHLIVERSVDSGTSWTVAIRVDDPGTGLNLLDEECPWDVGGAILVLYRVTGYRDSDRRSTQSIVGPWSGFSANPGAAFGLSSNEAGFSVAYVPADPTQVQVTWNPLNPVQLVPLHGQDYSYALRIPENRGLSVTVAVLVDYISYCCMPTDRAAVVVPLYDDSVAAYDSSTVSYDGSATPVVTTCTTAQDSSLADYSELLSKGGGSMSPRPYERDILNVFNSSATWLLKLPGGHTRFVTAQVGAMAITPAAGLYMAELTLTDITPPSADPYDE